MGRPALWRRTTWKSAGIIWSGASHSSLHIDKMSSARQELTCKHLNEYIFATYKFTIPSQEEGFFSRFFSSSKKPSEPPERRNLHRDVRFLPVVPAGESPIFEQQLCNILSHRVQWAERVSENKIWVVFSLCSYFCLSYFEYSYA